MLVWFVVVACLWCCHYWQLVQCVYRQWLITRLVVIESSPCSWFCLAISHSAAAAARFIALIISQPSRYHDKHWQSCHDLYGRLNWNMLLHFVTLWPWPLTFWPNIKWVATSQDAWWTIHVASLMIVVSAVYRADKHTHACMSWCQMSTSPVDTGVASSSVVCVIHATNWHETRVHPDTQTLKNAVLTRLSSRLKTSILPWTLMLLRLLLLLWAQ